jgi:hypothetical protein
MKQLKRISEIPEPMNAWQVAELIFGGSSVLLADEAFKQMKKAGWTFLEYDDNGEEVWQPPNKS